MRVAHPRIIDRQRIIGHAFGVELLTRPLADALADLIANMDLHDRAPADTPAAEKKAFRTASIQSFEFTYALAVKMIDRLLAADSAAPEEIEDMELQPRMRMAWEKGYVRDADAWADYRARRNITSHTYQEAKAVEVYAVLAAFVADVRILLDKARKASDAH